MAELSKLSPPPSLAHDWTQIIADRRKLATELVKLGGYARNGDAQAIQALTISKKRLHKHPFETASKDGFKHCSRVGGGSRRSVAPSTPSPTHVAGHAT